MSVRSPLRWSPFSMAVALSLTGVACSSSPTPEPSPPPAIGSSEVQGSPTASVPVAPVTEVAPPTTPAAIAPAATATATAAAATATAVATASASPAPGVPRGPSYLACGCGCCGEETAQKQCLYHAKGDDLEKIKASDKAARKSPRCATMGCSFGTEYSYCD